MMEEAEAKAWLEATFDVSRETFDRLHAFLELLRSENSRQNLVSPASLETLWARHIADSAQLLRFAPPRADWLDIGSGAGFPGLIVALFHAGPVTLVEPRRLRAAFLHQAAACLGVEVEIVELNVQSMTPREFGAISARAVAPLDRLLTLAAPFAGEGTVLILPKGSSAKSELEARGASWQGRFRIESSMTDPAAGIIVASGVRRPARR